MENALKTKIEKEMSAQKKKLLFHIAINLNRQKGRGSGKGQKECNPPHDWKEGALPTFPIKKKKGRLSFSGRFGAQKKGRTRRHLFRHTGAFYSKERKKAVLSPLRGKENESTFSKLKCISRFFIPKNWGDFAGEKTGGKPLVVQNLFLLRGDCKSISLSQGRVAPGEESSLQVRKGVFSCTRDGIRILSKKGYERWGGPTQRNFPEL